MKVEDLTKKKNFHTLKMASMPCDDLCTISLSLTTNSDGSKIKYWNIFAQTLQQFEIEINYYQFCDFYFLLVSQMN